MGVGGQLQFIIASSSVHRLLSAVQYHLLFLNFFPSKALAQSTSWTTEVTSCASSRTWGKTNRTSTGSSVARVPATSTTPPEPASIRTGACSSPTRATTGSSRLIVKADSCSCWSCPTLSRGQAAWRCVRRATGTTAGCLCAFTGAVTATASLASPCSRSSLRNSTSSSSTIEGQTRLLVSDVLFSCFSSCFTSESGKFIISTWAFVEPQQRFWKIEHVLCFCLIDRLISDCRLLLNSCVRANEKSIC